MDILSLRARWLAGAAVLAVLLVTACVWMKDEPQAPGFSHALHVGGQGMDCLTCHSLTGPDGSAGMPNPKICAACHDTLDRDRPADRQARSFFDESGRYRARQVAALPDEVIFYHQKHVQNFGVACNDCHGEVQTWVGIPAESAVQKDDCLSCHREAGRDMDCAVCHREIDRGFTPATHLFAWDRRHGPTVRDGDRAIANRCDMCHEESGCAQCHQVTEPADHTNQWRQRGHGLTAALDRARCEICHQTNSCDRCHQESRPLSHSAGFGSPRNNHCRGCHFPVQSESCFTCHKGTPGHERAKPLPANHHPAMNCRQCHGVTAPLPHPDQGDLCIQCHR